MITPQEFIERWKHADLNERQSAQLHFADVCSLIGHPPPTGLAPDGKEFKFEKGIQKDSGGQGYADVYYEGHFAIEYKAQGKDLNAAYQQLKQYRENLKNPPLLVVCDIQNWVIHTNFTGTETKTIHIKNEDIPKNLKIIRALFEDPERLHPERTRDEVTVEAATSFKAIVDEMRDEWKADPERIAHFMTKLVFCLFAEDVELLPQMERHGIFSHVVEETRMDKDASRFERYMRDLFKAMADGGEMLMKSVRYFNGSLFDDILVEPLSASARNKLADACRLNWSSVEPAIFGTLFERSLDPAKRAQLGAHYTSRDDILLIVEPVLMQPLRREWERIQQEAAPIRQIFDKPDSTRTQTNAKNQLIALREQMLHQLRSVKVLDPACGSGNFLYVSLGLLLDLEKEVINHPLWVGLTQPLPEVHPRQLYGIEVNEIAHALASIVVWIGYIQWKQNNGYLTFHEPILENLEGNILKMDAILAFDAEGKPIEPEWPSVDVIVGNPPFLGGQKLRSELGDTYLEYLWKAYENRVPGGADLVCYWFEKARNQIEAKSATRAGLLATNSIRGGSNREVLTRIKKTGDIFMGWSDRGWILDGAAVRVSMVGFDKGGEIEKYLDGKPVDTINADLTTSVDITKARSLPENHNISFQGIIKTGEFDITQEVAEKMLKAENDSPAYNNADVIKPVVNAQDITQGSRKMYLIDFGSYMPLEDAQNYKAPFAHLEAKVKPLREGLRESAGRGKWWIHQRSRPEMRAALAGLSRYICTPRVSKHRIFVWLTPEYLPSDATVAIARDDDYFFGVLHSKIHEAWSLRMGTWLGKGNDPRYTPTTTFETFPFPVPPIPNPSPTRVEGSHAAPLPLSSWERGSGGEGEKERWNIPPELHQKMTEIARQFRKEPTPSEAILWQALRGKQVEGRKFRRQQPIGPFVVDFYCPSERLVVEVDGLIHESQQEADVWRQQLIESLGIRFVRVTAAEVEQHLAGVLAEIRRAFNAPPHPQPFPHKEGRESLTPPLAMQSDSTHLTAPPLPSWERGPGGEGAIAAAAKQLHEERHAWLNPVGVAESKLKERTLTNLYNALNVYRGKEKIGIKKDAGDFAPRLDELHRALDAAVCAAYGWDVAILEDEEAILRELLALNLARANSNQTQTFGKNS